MTSAKTIQELNPEAEIILTELNFKLIFNLVVNILGKMLVSNSLDFPIILVVMDICLQTCWHGTKKNKYNLNKESEIRTYFGQMQFPFWEELFWHELTLSYKNGESAPGVDEHKDKWTEDLLLDLVGKCSPGVLKSTK